MLLIRMSSRPKTTVGRTMAWLRPDSRSARSSTALPRKYGSGESSEGFVMLTCTTRSTPASAAAANRIRVCATAASKSMAPCAKRTQ